MADFQNLQPGKDITDPDNLAAAGGGAYPKHLHRWVAEETEGSVIVAWKGENKRKKSPVHNEFCEVGSPEELAVKLAEGWSEKPVLEEPPAKAAKPAKGKKDDAAADAADTSKA